MYIVFFIIWITDFLGFYFYYKTTFKGKLLNCFFLYQTLLKIVKYDKSTSWSEVKMWFYQWNFILERMLKKKFFFLHFNFFFAGITQAVHACRELPVAMNWSRFYTTVGNHSGLMKLKLLPMMYWCRIPIGQTLTG